MKKGVFLYLFLLLLVINLSNAAVPDADQDGVPDSNDRCPNSDTNVVDQFGCSCAQKTTSNCASSYSGAQCCVSDNNPCTDDCGVVNGLATCNAINNNNQCQINNQNGYCRNGECLASVSERVTCNFRRQQSSGPTGNVVGMDFVTGFVTTYSDTLQATPRTVNQNDAVTISWNANIGSRLTLNPGNIDVTGRTSYIVRPQSDTIYSLTAESGSTKTVYRAFVKVNNQLPRITGLWIGPWYTPRNEFPYIDDTKTVTRLKQDFGANMINYNLDWIVFDYWNSNNFRANYQSNVNKFISFCQARIAEAQSTNTYIFWQTIVPFEKANSRAYKIQFLEDISPCFNSPFVLGMHTIDEPSGESPGKSWDKESMHEGYNLFKERYPDKLVWYNELPLFTDASVESARGWDWGDVVSLDFYIIPTPNVQGHMNTMMQTLKRLAGERDAWFIHQAAPMNIFLDQPESSREPTPEELRTLAELSWNNELQGIVWWGMVQNNLIPQHNMFAPQGSFRREFFPDENFKAALRQINNVVCGNGACVERQCTDTDGRKYNPGNIVLCGDCGTKTCRNDGSFGPCTGDGSTTTITEGCIKCARRTRTCNIHGGTYSYGQCGGEGTCSSGETQQRTCPNGEVQTRTCTNLCSWPDYPVCQPCTPNSQKRCDGNAIYWYDSCNNRGTLFYDCNQNALWKRCNDAKCCLPGNFFCYAPPSSCQEVCTPNEKRCKSDGSGYEECADANNDGCYAWESHPCQNGCENGNCFVNQVPEGFLDEISTEGIIRGWALDRNHPSDSIDVKIYFDGPADSGIFISSVNTNVLRQDVNQAKGVTGNHGFTFSIPNDYRDGRQHLVYVYGIDRDDSSGNSNRQLNGIPKTFSLSSAISAICYSDKGQCSGQGSCTVDISGTQNEQVSWISSCGGNRQTTINGQPESITFDCSSSQNCHDSDGGRNFYSKGLTLGLFEGQLSAMRDSCDSLNVIEYSCSGSSVIRQQQQCQNGCLDGKCNSDPCTGVSCNNPPQPNCVNANTKRTFTGTCNNGQCSYANYNDENCAQNNGKCENRDCVCSNNANSCGTYPNCVNCAAQGKVCNNGICVGNSNSPIGSFDIGNCEFVRGWALDQDTPTAQITVEWYKNATGNTRVLIERILTSSTNPNAATYFVRNIPAALRDGETYNLTLIALDTGGDASKNTLLPGSPKTIRCASDTSSVTFTATKGTTTGTQISVFIGEEVTLRWTSPAGSTVTINNDIGAVSASGETKVTPIRDAAYILTAATPNGEVSKSVIVEVVNRPPIGWLDIANCEFVRGWALDEDAKNIPIQVHVYADGPAGSGTLIGDMTTTAERPDVNSAYQATGTHGFVRGINSLANVVPFSLKDGRQHTLHFYGIDSSLAVTGDHSKNKELSGSPKTIKCTGDQTLIDQTRFIADKTSITAGEEVTLSWITASSSAVKILDHNNNQLPNVQGAAGNVRVRPRVSTTYVFTATYENGDVTKSLTVNVAQAGQVLAYEGGQGYTARYLLIPPSENQGPQKTLVIIASIGGQSPIIDVEKASNLIFGTENSVNDYYIKNSYNKVSLTGNVVGPYSLPSVECDQWKILEATIKAADPYVDFRKEGYSRIVLFVTPCNRVIGTGTLGKTTIKTQEGDISASVSWNFAPRLDVAGHEFGHNFGLGHAGFTPCLACQSYEYGDRFSIMSYDNTHHLSALHKELAGWLTNNEEVGGGEYRGREYRDYLLKPLELNQPSGSIQQIKIPLSYGVYYSLSFRQPIDYDEGMTLKAYSGIFMHIPSDHGLSTLLINYNPSFKLVDRTPLLQIGRPFRDKENDFEIVLKSVTSDGALLSIQPYGTFTYPIEIIYPKGGESWNLGSTQTILWKSDNVVEDQMVNLRLVRTIDNLVYFDLGNTTLKEGSMQIVVPDTLGQYKVEIFSYNDDNIFSESEPVNIIFEEKCKDSDGGKNYDVRGRVIATTNDRELHVAEDGCCQSKSPSGFCVVGSDFRSGPYVLEFFCDPDGKPRPHIGYWEEVYECPNGCNDGACIKE